MRYVLIQRYSYNIILDTEKDQIVFLSKDLCLCRKQLELYNATCGSSNS